MMRDAVESLLVQCHVVRVFLNEYADVPDFLEHPRIRIKRSQDWDDKGDAGKFAWIDTPDDEGYRVIVDDDLVFPPDFVDRMAAALDRHGNRAIAGMHGILLKYPLENYYDRELSHGFSFSVPPRGRTHGARARHECARLPLEQRIMRWDDFMFRNMADIFLARHAQENRIPMIAVGRAWSWVRQNSQLRPFETIYDSSLKRSRSKFDSSLVQDNVVKSIAPLRLQPTARPKIALCIIGTDRGALDALLASWRATQSAQFDWSVLIANAAGNGALKRYLAALKLPAEVHIFDRSDCCPGENVREMLLTAAMLGAAMVCVALNSLRFAHSDWAVDAHAHIEASGGIGLFAVSNAADRFELGAEYSPNETCRRSRYCTRASLQRPPPLPTTS